MTPVLEHAAFGGVYDKETAEKVRHFIDNIIVIAAGYYCGIQQFSDLQGTCG